jgi:cytochrome c-type biogenesis protein CcmH
VKSKVNILNPASSLNFRKFKKIRRSRVPVRGSPSTGGNPSLVNLSGYQRTWIPAYAGTTKFTDFGRVAFVKSQQWCGVSSIFAINTAPVLGFNFVRLAGIILLALLFSASISAQTATPAMPPAPPELEARLKKLETELRCLVCQNQTLAESPAGLAGDLRREIRLLADSGKSNEEIKEFLRVRYGDFVLYNPPMSGKTYLLWFGPFALLAGGAAIAFLMARQRRLKIGVVQPSMSEAEQKRADALLKGDDENKSGDDKKQ